MTKIASWIFLHCPVWLIGKCNQTKLTFFSQRIVFLFSPFPSLAAFNRANCPMQVVSYRNCYPQITDVFGDISRKLWEWISRIFFASRPCPLTRPKVNSITVSGNYKFVFSHLDWLTQELLPIATAAEIPCQFRKRSLLKAAVFPGNCSHTKTENSTRGSGREIEGKLVMFRSHWCSMAVNKVGTKTSRKDRKKNRLRSALVFDRQN